ncbi:MAG TPA: DUF1572 family protein [Bacteroidia bacterium]|jgi:uncharacterized damage-inducible protein DinB|nr:DUF1572 family protein [Bacteroidia bacterium]HRG52088.1 DUF1572 family protein [Bacteroidia bacterium]
MSKAGFIEFFERDLTALEKEITSYTDEKNLWIVSKHIKNSAGNICLHVIGNLNHFVGAILGKNGYIRDRDKEFSTHDVSRTELMNALEKTKHLVTNTLTKLSSEQYNNLYPIEFLGKNIMTDQMLLQLATHLNYHLGQINYHRRLLDKK